MVRPVVTHMDMCLMPNTTADEHERIENSGGQTIGLQWSITSVFKFIKLSMKTGE